MAREDFLQVNFRMPIALKHALEEQSRLSGRTLTAEIVFRLEQSLTAPISDTDLLKILRDTNEYLETISDFVREEPDAAKRVLSKRRTKP